MKRRKGSGKFHKEGFGGEDINPMDGLANLADCMLVFACGLMLALITYWNVDVAGNADVTQVQQGQEVSDVSGLDNNGNGEAVDGASLQQYGTVYRDPDTGKLYMVMEDDK